MWLLRVVSKRLLGVKGRLLNLAVVLFMTSCRLLSQITEVMLDIWWVGAKGAAYCLKHIRLILLFTYVTPTLVFQFGLF